MTVYDDCTYCSTCGWHHESCWCRDGVLRDPDEQVCHRIDPHKGPGGYGRADVACTPQMLRECRTCHRPQPVDADRRLVEHGPDSIYDPNPCRGSGQPVEEAR